jgi:NAD(P)-dependent dehydrogenase (short-subunit alcohol dehydrogenase family)
VLLVAAKYHYVASRERKNFAGSNKRNRPLFTGQVLARAGGLALVEHLVRAGGKVFIVGRRKSQLDAALARLGAASQGRAFGANFDIGDKHAIHPLIALAEDAIGPIDTLMHLASTLGPVPMPLLADLECEDFDRALQVNLLGAFRLTKTFAPQMALRGGTQVLFASSDAAITPYPNWGAYGVTKAAQDHLMRSFAVEFPAIRFTAFDPGEMPTEMHRLALPSSDEASLPPIAEVAKWVISEVVAKGQSGRRYAFPDAVRGEL